MQPKSIYTTDVVVLGGGTAGSIAAIAASRAGARVLLLERTGILGGTMTIGGVCFPGLFFAWGRQIIAGIGWEAVCRAADAGKTALAPVVYDCHRHWEQQTHLNPFAHAQTLDELCRESETEILFHTSLADAKEEADSVTLLCAGLEGTICVHAKIAIDASGDATLARVLGYPVEKSAELQPSTLFAHLTGSQPDDVPKETVEQAVKAAIADGRLPSHLEPYRLSACFQRQVLDFHTLTMADVDTSAGRSRLEQAARQNLAQVLSVFRTLPACASMQIASFAPTYGVRESVRILGQTRVTETDYLRGRVYQDAISYAFYPIDQHQTQGIRMIYPAEGVVPTVPLGALLPVGTRRLLCAGRILSSDTGANSALRVQAVCMACGQAAGVTASVCAQTNSTPASLNLCTIRGILQAQGAILPALIP